MKVWFWILITLIVLVGIGIAFYFLFFWNADSFPKTIGAYTLNSAAGDTGDCQTLEGQTQQACIDSYRLEYISGDLAVHVSPLVIKSGREAVISWIKGGAAQFNFEGKVGVIHGKEPWEIYWMTSKGKYDGFIVQTYKYHYKTDGSFDVENLNATTSNEVIQYFLDKYPPMSI